MSGLSLDKRRLLGESLSQAVVLPPHIWTLKCSRGPQVPPGRVQTWRTWWPFPATCARVWFSVHLAYSFSPLPDCIWLASFSASVF